MRSSPAQQRRETDALSLPLEFELEQSGERARMVLGGLLFFIIVCWALLAFAPIRAVVVASGAIKPVGEAVAVHHEQGGAVEAVMARRGEIVAEGQPLLQLRGGSLQSELQELGVRRLHLALRIERLRALLDDREPDFASMPHGDRIAVLAAAMVTEKRQFEAARTALLAELASFDAQRETRRASLRAFQNEAKALEPALAVLDERLEILKALRARGAVSNTDIFAVATQRADAHSRHASVEGQAGAALRELEEIEYKRSSLRAGKRAEWSADLTDALSGLAEVEEQIRRREDLQERLIIRAPVAGAVQLLGAAELGAVLPAGALAAEIVPVDRPLVARVKVSPDEIGHVEIGDEATLRINTFSRQVIGEIDGAVASISPTVFASEDGSSYYEVELSITSRLEDRADIRALTPGMSLTASLLGEESSVLAYLLEPFRRAMDLAFTSQ